MATITAPGIGSGLDGSSIIKQLMAIQRRPITVVQQKQAQVQSQISAFGKLKSAISTFQDTMSNLGTLSKFKQFSTTSSNESAFTVSATSTAAAGSYDVVVNSLAAASKQASSAYVDSATDIAGSGTLDISVGGDSFSVVIDGTNSTLNGIRDAINNATDNTGVTASIINESGGSRLIMTADESGTASAISITTADNDGNHTDATGLSRLFHVGSGADAYAREISAAADATLTVDGFDIISASNSVSGVIDGVTIDLVAGGGASGTLAVERDNEATKESLDGFVAAYNDLRSTIDSVYKGDLNRDSTLRTIERGLLNIVGSSVTIDGSSFSHLTEIGISKDKEGVMQLDAAKLTTALADDFGGLAKLFTDGTNGIAARLDVYADSLMGDSGLLSSRETGLDSRLRSLSIQEETLERRMLVIEARYSRQFAALDTMMASIQSSNSFLAQQFSG